MSLLSLSCAVSPPLPPPPSSDVDDRFSLLQSRAFDPRYSAVAGTSMPYVDDYGRDGYAGRRSQIDEEDEPWVPENYLEKGWHWNDLSSGLVLCSCKICLAGNQLLLEMAFENETVCACY